MAAIIREAIEDKLSRELLATAATGGKKASKRPLPKSIGRGASGHTDTSRLAGDMKFEPGFWR
jgi:hypothetical protein